MCAQLEAYDYRQSMLSESGQNNGSFPSSANNASRRPQNYNNRNNGNYNFLPPRGDYGRQEGGGYGRQDGGGYWRQDDGGYGRQDGGGYGRQEGGGYGRQDRQKNRGRPAGRFDGQGPGAPKGGCGRGRTPSPRQDVTCQICKKDGHPANECWWRYSDNDDDDSRTNEKAAYGVDTNWYLDTGATDHITSELNKLHTRDTYKGCDQVHNANGQGMAIKHIGHSILHTPHSSLQLRNILHVPSASKNLLSTHKNCSRQQCFC
jgi:histone deacetylase 1/2